MPALMRPVGSFLLLFLQVIQGQHLEIEGENNFILDCKKERKRDQLEHEVKHIC